MYLYSNLEVKLQHSGLICKSKLGQDIGRNDGTGPWGVQGKRKLNTKSKESTSLLF